MSALEAQYKELTGKDADARWSPDTLRRKVDEAKQENQPFGGKGDHDNDGKAGGAKGVEPIGDVDGPSKEAKTGAPMSDEGQKLPTEDTPKAVKSGVKLDEHTMLIAKAQELLVEVDEDWDDDRLRAEIQMAREGRADLQVKGAVPPAGYGDVNYDSATKQDKEPEIPVTLEADYWDANENRISKGTNLNLRKSEASKLINEGKAKRNDPLPG